MVTPGRRSGGAVFPLDLSNLKRNESHDEPNWKTVLQLGKGIAVRPPSSARNSDVDQSGSGRRTRHSPPSELSGLSAPGCCVTFSSDGHRMAVGDKGAIKGCASVTIWSLSEAVPQLPPVICQVKSKVDALAFSPDGRFLASGPGAEINSKRTRAIVIWSEVQPGRFAADGTVSGMSWKVWKELDIDIAQESGPQSCSLMFWQSGWFLTIGVWQCDPKQHSNDKCGRIELWDVEKPNRYKSAVHGCPAVKDFLDPPRTLESFSYSPDYTEMVVGTMDRDSSPYVVYVSILFVDPNNWHNSPEVRLLSFSIGQTAEAIRGVAWSSDGNWVAAACCDQLNVWNAPRSLKDCNPKQAPSPTWELLLQTDGIGPIAFSPDGRCIAAAGAHEGIIALWDVETGAIARQWHCRPNIKSVAFAPKAAMIAAVAEELATVLFFNLEGSIYERECVPVLPPPSLHPLGGNDKGPYDRPRAVLSADGAFLAVAVSNSGMTRQGLVTIFALATTQGMTSDLVLAWDNGVLKDLDVCSCNAQQQSEKHRKLVGRFNQGFECRQSLPANHSRSGGPQLVEQHAEHPRQLVAVLTSERLYMWNLLTKAELQGLPRFENATHISISRDSHMAIVIGTDAHYRSVEASRNHPLITTQGSYGNVTFSMVVVDDLEEHVSEPDSSEACDASTVKFRLHGNIDRGVQEPRIHNQKLNIQGPVLAISFVDGGPTDHVEDVRHVAIAVKTDITLLSISARKKSSLEKGFWEEKTFPVKRRQNEAQVSINAIAAHRVHLGNASTWLIAGYGSDQLLLWKIDENGDVFRIMAVNVTLVDEMEPVALKRSTVRTRRGDHPRHSHAASTERQRCRLRISPLGESLSIATGQRLIVWEDLRPEIPGSPWTRTHDMRFAGQLWDCNYDLRQVPSVVHSRKPRGLLVYDDSWAAQKNPDWTQPPVFWIYDLFEYSLAFHLPDLRLVVRQFGPSGIEGRLAACPSLLTQRLYPQDLGWTLYHWAAWEGNVDVVKALCQDFKAHSDSGSPFAIDLFKKNSVDYALRGRHFGIIDEILQAAVQEPKMLSNLLPESHTALTKTIVKLLRHPVPMLAAFLDFACLLEPQVVSGELPTKAAHTEENPIRTTQVLMPVISLDDVEKIAPSGDFEQPIHIRMLCLRGALDVDIGLVKALCETANDEVLATQTAKIYLMHKWAQHKRKGFYVDLGLYLIYLMVFSTWTIDYRQKSLDPDTSAWDELELKDNISLRPTMFFTRFLMAALTMYFASIEIRFLVRETAMVKEEESDFRETQKSRLSSASRKCFIGFQTYFLEVWNWFDMARIASVFYILVYNLQTDAEIVSIAALFMWMRLLHYCRGFENTNALVRSLTETMKQMQAFLVLCCIFWFAFSHCFYILLRVDPFLDMPDGKEGGILDSVIFCYRLVFLGESDIAVEQRIFLMQVLFMGATFISSVVALNMLIAIMGDTYSSVQDDEMVARHKELAHLVYEFETLQGGTATQGRREYLLAGFRRERQLQDINMSEAQQEIRPDNSQRALEKELRKEDHLLLHKMSRRMIGIEQMIQSRGSDFEQLSRSVRSLRDDIHRIKLASSPEQPGAPKGLHEDPRGAAMMRKIVSSHLWERDVSAEADNVERARSAPDHSHVGVHEPPPPLAAPKEPPDELLPTSHEPALDDRELESPRQPFEEQVSSGNASYGPGEVEARITRGSSC